MAVIRSLGMTRGQARWSVVVQATTLAAIGILIGVPLGIVAGQLVWRSLADAVPFVYERPWALFAVLLAPIAAIVISNLLAAVPARRAARLAPAEVLRAE
jgi:ABC-type antimicrobial peptide transport system permease subunit